MIAGEEQMGNKHLGTKRSVLPHCDRLVRIDSLGGDEADRSDFVARAALHDEFGVWVE